MLRALPHLLWIVGVALLALGFIHLSMSFLPYQDPTPAQLQEQADDMHVGNLKLGIGGGLLVVGVGWLIIRKLRRDTISMSTWNPPIPLNIRTGVFCFLMGAVFSVPVGTLPTKFLLWEPSDFMWDVYMSTVIASFLVLPFWCVFSVRQYRALPVLGLFTFIVGALLGLLFPAI